MSTRSNPNYVIHKIVIPIGTTNAWDGAKSWYRAKLPCGSVPFSCGFQLPELDKISVWYRRSVPSELVSHFDFYMFGTGKPIYERLSSLYFLGTCIDNQRSLAWHIFYKHLLSFQR